MEASAAAAAVAAAAVNGGGGGVPSTLGESFTQQQIPSVSYASISSLACSSNSGHSNMPEDSGITDSSGIVTPGQHQHQPLPNFAMLYNRAKSDTSTRTVPLLFSQI